ncbi:MAG: hypothetical protein J1E40_02610 [Oscillospiraceae bacterium]|nr:hypothetical protein [Oscillospiraceae bacterium]
MAKNSEAHIKANNRYNAKAYDEVKFRVKKGEKKCFQSYLEKRQYSLNRFVNSCVSYCIENDIDVSTAKPLGEVLSDKED